MMEAFGADYELPNLTAYNETYAAIDQMYLNYRMFLLHGESNYIDCLERTLYNGVFSGMRLDGASSSIPILLRRTGCIVSMRIIRWIVSRGSDALVAPAIFADSFPPCRAIYTPSRTIICM